MKGTKISNWHTNNRTGISKQTIIMVRVSDSGYIAVYSVCEPTLQRGADFLLGWYFALNFQVMRSPKISVQMRTTQRYIPEDNSIQTVIYIFTQMDQNMDVRKYPAA
jgi:hypothetical protein